MGVDDVRLTQTPILPATPTHLTPFDGTLDVPLEGINLRFTMEAHALRYNLQVATDMAFQSKVLDVNVPKSPVEFVPPEPGTTYYWRVQSEGVHGFSPFSAPWSVTSFNPVPEVPTLMSPANGATDLDADVHLMWKTADFAERYDAQVSQDSTFETVLFKHNTPGLDAHFVAPFSGESYFWRVQAFGPGGASPGFSATWKFSVGAVGSLIPTELSPADGAIGRDREHLPSQRR